MRQSFLFIAYYPIDSISSGPKVRINSLKNEFKKNCDLIFISGTAIGRFRQYLRFILKKENKKVKYSYIEPSTSTAWPADLLFLIYLKFIGIKFAIYIRDAYPKFSEFWKDLRIYQYPFYWGWYFSIWIFHQLADQTYYPTFSLQKLFKTRNGDLLPPGANHLNNKFSVNSCTILYAGNINQRYGKSILIEMMKELRKINSNIRLDLVSHSIPPSGIPEGLGIRIIAGSLIEIEKFNDRYFIAIIPRLKNKYNDLALPVKLFDYMSLGLPVIASNCNEQESFIIKNEIGVICDDNPIDFVNAIIKLHAEKEKLINFHLMVIKAINTKHSWSHRTDKIIQKFQTSINSSV